jgi:sugar lactone lactonase YvrE
VSDAAAATPDVAVDCSCTLGESPVWSAAEQALYWVDLRAPALHRLDVTTGATRTWPMPALIGGVVLRERAGPLVALQNGIHALDLATGECTLVVAPEPVEPDRRLNETKCDRAGRLWTSTMRDFGLTATGSLYRIGHDRVAHRVLTDLRVPNALCWSPDDTTMYLADTRDGRLRAYAWDRDGGTPGPMRVLVDDGVLPGAPDGAIVDADGCVWNARYGGGAVARITPDGVVDRVVALPVPNVTSCALGGADLRTLYVTTARQRMSAEELAAMPSAGAVFALRVSTPGLPDPACTL